MKTFVAAATVLSLAQGLFALTINTPTNVVVCQPILLTWADGTAPYYLSIIPGGQPSAAALKTFPTQDGTSYTWNVDIQGAVTILLKDSTGATAYSDIVNINSQQDMSCLTQTSSDSTDASATPTAGNTSAASGTTTATGATTTGASAGTSAGNSANTSKTSAASTSKTTSATPAANTSNAASKSHAGAYGMAGLMALVGLAVF